MDAYEVTPPPAPSNSSITVLFDFLSLSRLKPDRASLRLPGEGQPHAELLLQQRGGRGEDVEAPGREFRAEARRDWRHERRPAALRESEHGRLQHTRPADAPGADREAGCRGVALCGCAGQQRGGWAAGHQQFSQPDGLSFPMPVSIPTLCQRLNMWRSRDFRDSSALQHAYIQGQILL